MRKTQALLNTPVVQESIYNGQGSVYNGQGSIYNEGDPTLARSPKTRDYRLVALWAMSNILSFTMGYYIKTKYYTVNCLDGSHS